jgi:thymidylate synthase
MLYENEEGYLKALLDIKNHGEKRNTRNGITLSTFGVNLRFDIRNTMPLLTTKRVYWKIVLSELLWFISGNTNSYDLSLNNVHIWNGNSSRRFLDSQGLHHYQVGDCGPIYGYQWRHFNAPYRGCTTPRDEICGGVDQLQNCIDLIRNEPTSRRIFMSAWNPDQLNEMCLPPCHVSYQFYVNEHDEISCILYQRSGDMFLGVPFNIASTAFLVNILAHMTGKKTGFVSLCIGDAHIYESHLYAVDEQLSRDPSLYEKPALNILCEPKENINDYKFEYFDIPNYNHHPSIRADMIA